MSNKQIKISGFNLIYGHLLIQIVISLFVLEIINQIHNDTMTQIGHIGIF